jgi:drug/metabolite transporter (DMT)-like permease
MNVRQRLEDWIRGWLPKEPNSSQRKLNATTALSPPKPVRVLIMIGILAVIVALVVLFYVPFIDENSVARGVSTVVLVVIGLVTYKVYGRDFYRAHPKQQRAVLIFTSGAFLAFTGMIVFSVVLGSPKPYLPYLWIPIILLALIGALIGDLIAQRLQKHV